VCLCLSSKFRAESDLEHVQQDRSRMSSRMQQLERDLMQVQLREKQLGRSHKILTGKLKTEKDEVLHRYVCTLHQVLILKSYLFYLIEKRNNGTGKMLIVKCNMRMFCFSHFSFLFYLFILFNVAN